MKLQIKSYFLSVFLCVSVQTAVCIGTDTPLPGLTGSAADHLPDENIAPFIVGGDPIDNWYVNTSNYSNLNSATVSDSWSSGITSDENVIVRKVYTDPRTTSASGGYNASIVYYDGTGTPAQSIEVKGSASGKDLVTPAQPSYVQAGEILTYLPYPSQTTSYGEYRQNALTEQEQYYSSAFSLSDPRAYLRQKFEMAPDGRILENTRPGFDPSTSSVSQREAAAAEDAVMKIVYSPSTGGFTVASDYYAPGAFLEKTTTTDEDGRVTETYMDGRGNIILSRYGTDADTYYVYDELDRLSYIVSPEGSLHLEKGHSYSPDSALVRDYCFCYAYDSRGRNAGKRVPGRGWEYCVYDRGGRIVLLQDANMRRAGEDEDIQYWIKYDYDSLGRMVSQMMTYSPLTRTREEFQSLADEGRPITVVRKALLAEYRYDSAFEYEYRDIPVKTDRWLLMYDLAQDTKWPSVAASDSSRVLFAPDQTIKREFLIGSLLTPSGRSFLAYYIPEEYAYLATAMVAGSDKCVITQNTPMRSLLSQVRTMVKTPFSFEPVEGICSSSDKDYRTRGLKTQENVAVLSSGMNALKQFVTRLFYYDSRGRVIQIAERNPQGGVSRYSMKYDFSGRVTLMQETHQRTAGRPDSDTKRTQYTYDKHGRILSQTVTLNKAEATVTYTYDELGRLSSRTTRGTGTSTPVEIQYKYDIRGQLTSISSSSLYSQANQYSSAGNITRMTLNAPYFKVNNVFHTYYYDDMNRLRRSIMEVASKPVTYEMDYDLNGNITRFLRDKRTLSKSIAQYYSYEGNQLYQMQRTATDTADSPGMHRFGYDGNGNMIGKRTENGQPLIDFGYNYLNLTDAISTPQGTRIYTWLADGTKVKSRQVSGGQESGTVYLGSLMYDYTNTTLSVETLFDGGMIGNAQAGDYSTLYITDHLGSVRVLVSGGPMLFNEYEPFGLLAKEYSVNFFPQMPPQLNDRLFNGKQELFPAGESILDYGARLYDPTLARWIAPDPLAEIYYSESPFSFSGNNPINNVDINGMSYQEPEPKYIYDWDTNKYLDQETDEAVNFETFWSWVMETYPVEVVDGIFRSASNTLSTPKFDGNTYFSLDGSQYSVNSPDVLDVIARDLAKLNFNEAQPILNSLMDSISHIQWSEGMPTQIQILNILFVVPVSTLTYTDATSKTLKNQYENYLIETGQYSRLHPYYTPNLSGDMAMIFGFLVMNTWAPVGFPLSGLDYSEKITFDIAAAQHKASYYRKDGIIK